MNAQPTVEQGEQAMARNEVLPTRRQVSDV